MPARSRAPWTARPVPTERVYRGAVIGSGGIARSAHLPAFRQGAGVRDPGESVAIVDSGPVAPVEGLPLLRRPEELERLGAMRLTAAGAPWRGTCEASRGGVVLDHGTHLLYKMLDVDGAPTAVRSWTGRLLHRQYDFEDTASVVLEYLDRMAVLFLTWAARHRETRIRFIGDAGTIEWVGGELRLDSGARVERLGFTPELDQTSYWRWFACLFADFVAALDRGDGAAHLQDIAQVAALLERAYDASRPLTQAGEAATRA